MEETEKILLPLIESESTNHVSTLEISSEAISVTNTAFVGEGVVMIALQLGHIYGGRVGEVCGKKREASEQAKNYA